MICLKFLNQIMPKRKDVLFATNMAIIKDVDRLDIFRKIVKRIWISMIKDDKTFVKK